MFKRVHFLGIPRHFRVFRFLALALTATCLTPIAGNTQDLFCSSSNDFEIVAMLDFTGSSRAEHVTAEKNAIRSVLDFFDTAATKPRIALGTFNTSATLRNELTTDYAAIRASLDALPEKGSGGTRIYTALKLARDHFAAKGDPSKAKYLLLLSDGLTAGVSDTEKEAAAIKAEGTKIFAIHYPVPANPTQEIPGAPLMRDKIASEPASDYYLTVQDDLVGALRKIVVNLACEDGKACTRNYCDLTSGTCKSEEYDNDGDGIGDCVDLCPKQSDALVFSGIIGIDADGDGSDVCVDSCPDDPSKTKLGMCGCGVPDTDSDGDGFADCLGCTLKDNTELQFAMDGNGLTQRRMIRQIARKVSRVGDSAARAQAKKAIDLADALYKEAWTRTWTLPRAVIVCTSTTCSSTDEFATHLNRYREIADEFDKLAADLAKTLKAALGASKAGKRLGKKVAKLRADARTLSSQFPTGQTECATQ